MNRLHAIAATTMLALGLHATPALGADNTSELTCEFDVPKQCTSGSARVTFKGDTLDELAVESFTCGLPGKPGYACDVSFKRGDKESTWSDANGATIIDKKSPFDSTRPDRIKVTVGKFISIDLAEVQVSGACGAGAELPSALVITKGKHTCRVWTDRR
jgi:hypothetical protein